MTSAHVTPTATRIAPPFTLETARAKVKAAENAWNTRDPEIVARAYTEDSEWRNRISVRFEYEWHDAQGQWYRTHGNEHWEFDDEGLMRRRDMSGNDYRIQESERRYRQR